VITDGSGFFKERSLVLPLRQRASRPILESFRVLRRNSTD
jgi:hypothetical protein